MKKIYTLGLSQILIGDIAQDKGWQNQFQL